MKEGAMFRVKSGWRFRTVTLLAGLGFFGCDTAAAQVPSVSYTTYSVPSLASINWVATKPDNALWFTKAGPTKTEIRQITTAGAVTEYPISNTPGMIVTKPDDAL